jgi:hypothetical protein
MQIVIQLYLIPFMLSYGDGIHSFVVIIQTCVLFENLCIVIES